jgi:hypothetical protein
MPQIAIIMIIRNPDIDEIGFINTFTDVLPDDDDKTLVDWIRSKIRQFFEEEEIEYEDLETFLDDYYSKDSEDALLPFQVSYYNIKTATWEYLKDGFIEKILDNWSYTGDLNMDDDEYYEEQENNDNDYVNYDDVDYDD